MNEELPIKYRPTEFKDVVGQSAAVSQIRDWGKRKAVPRFILFTGASGCLEGSTVIYDPSDGTSLTIRERCDLGVSFHVLSLDVDNKVVVALAMPPVRYSPDRLFRVETSESVVCVTNEHLFLSLSGEYLSLKELCERRFSDVPLLSSWGIFQEVQHRDVHRWKRIGLDCQDHCSAYSYPYGESPLSESKVFQETVPLQVDVQEHNNHELVGVEACGFGHSRQHRFDAHLSMPDCWNRPLQNPVDELVSLLPVKSSLFDDVPFQRIGQFLSGTSQIDTVLQSSNPDDYCGDVVCEDKLPLACFSPFEGPTTSSTIIQRVVEIGQGEYFDFHVPFTENYWAGGLWNHNCGKTTLARILRTKMKCSNRDFREINAAEYRGIDMVRDIKQNMGYTPMGGKVRVWLVDEAHKLTPDAQGAFLKELEDGAPKHAYFMFATTDPQKLLKTIRTRATEIKVQPVKNKEMSELLNRVCEAEGIQVSEEVLDKIVEVSENSPRKALVILNQVIGLDEDEQLDAVKGSVAETEAIELCRVLMNSSVSWGQVVKVLKGIEDLNGQAESIRWMVISYMSSVALGGNPGRAIRIIEAFQDNFYDSKRAGLISACFEVVNG